ncbi:MAG: ATP12 family protein [Caulobacter sp.]|nr:ATP12 family protein [Caulobacter sp.]
MSEQGDGVQRPRRFYKAVAVGEIDGGFAPLLDGRPPKTPSGARLVVPNAALAGLLAGEWDAQREVIDPARMPLTRLAATTIDHVAAAREPVAEEIVRYAGSDLLCYFAEAPDSLVADQAGRWGPWLDWAERELGVRLERGQGIQHRAQPEASLARVRALSLELDAFSLTGLADLTALLGSTVLALAVQRRALTAAEAFVLSRLDEAFQEARWGVDDEALARTEGRRGHAERLGEWLAALA